jgi:hypothetical protein
MDTLTGQTPAQRRASDVASGAMVLLRRIPIDFRRVAEESGFSRGNLCYSHAFGWGVQKIPGSYGVDFATITAPAMQAGETTLRIRDNHWCFYGPAAATDPQENIRHEPTPAE